MTQVPPVEKIVEAHDEAIVGSFYLPDGRCVGVSTYYPEDPDAPVAQPWQSAAWQVWKCLGELKSPTTYVARVVSRRIDWVWFPDGAEEPLDLKASRAVLKDAFGESNVDELVRLIVLNVEVAGEFWIIREDNSEDGRARWCVYSVVERYLKEKVDAAKKTGRPFLRVWVADPTCIRAADAPTSGILDSAYDLIELKSLSRAQSRSRIAGAGMLLVPAEQKFAQSDPFGSTLEEAMLRPIEDISSATAVAPIKVTMQSDMIDKVRHVTFDRPFDDRLPEKMDRATRQLAMGMDFPPELLLGMGDQNHWNGWITQEETYRGTIAPLAELVANILTWVVTTETPFRMGAVAPDPTELLTRHATPQDAINAASIGAVSLAYVRRALGASENGDEQPPEDTALIIALSSNVAPGVTTADQSTTDTRSAPNEGVAP